MQAQCLEERLESFEKIVQDTMGAKNLQSLASASQDISVFCGRVCCDTEGGKLNSQSVILEGSHARSFGARVKVDLSGCKDFRIFPGQVVAVVGTNPSGFCIVAKEIITSFPNEKVDRGFESTNVVIAAGPYTSSTNMAYTPLDTLLAYCKKAEPMVLLLVGPFLDADHPQVKSGLMEHSFEDVFEARIMRKVKKFIDETNGKTRVLLMPSHQDVHHECVVPQRPLTTFNGTEDENLHCIPNPCTFSTNGITFGSSSIDWLKSCTKEEISKSSTNVDRLPKLAAHIVQQRRWVNLFFANVSKMAYLFNFVALQLLPNVTCE